MVARILFLLLLHCSAWPRLDPAQQDLHTFLFPSVCISTLFIGKRHSLQIRLQVLPREVHPRNAAESTPSCVQSQDCILDDYFQMFQSLTLNGTFWMFFFYLFKIGANKLGLNPQIVWFADDRRNDVVAGGALVAAATAATSQSDELTQAASRLYREGQFPAWSHLECARAGGW